MQIKCKSTIKMKFKYNICTNIKKIKILQMIEIYSSIEILSCIQLINSKYGTDPNAQICHILMQ